MALQFLSAITLLVVLASLPPGTARAEGGSPHAWHAWGLDVDADGVIYAADGREEPGFVWRIDPAAFDHSHSSSPGSEDAGTDPGSAGATTSEAGNEPFGDTITLLLGAPGIRDLQLVDRTLYVSSAQVVQRETVLGDSVSLVEHGLLRLDLESSSPVPETFIEWTSVDSLFSGPCFRVDRKGGVYFYSDGRLRYRDAEGEARTFLGSEFRGQRDGGLGEGRFNEVRAMSLAEDGDLFLVDVARIRRVFVEERRVDTFATELIQRGIQRGARADDDEDPRWGNRIYGITPNESGSRVWVAYHGGSRLLSARRSGRTGTYYEPADSSWGPVGVAWTEDALYVLEVRGQVTRELRITRVSSEGETRVSLPRRD